MYSFVRFTFWLYNKLFFFFKLHGLFSRDNFQALSKSPASNSDHLKGFYTYSLNSHTFVVKCDFNRLTKYKLSIVMCCAEPMQAVTGIRLKPTNIIKRMAFLLCDALPSPSCSSSSLFVGIFYALSFCLHRVKYRVSHGLDFKNILFEALSPMSCLDASNQPGHFQVDLLIYHPKREVL